MKQLENKFFCAAKEINYLVFWKTVKLATMDGGSDETTAAQRNRNRATGPGLRKERRTESEHLLAEEKWTLDQNRVICGGEHPIQCEMI